MEVAAPSARPVPDSLREWARSFGLVAVFAGMWVALDYGLWFWDDGDRVGDRVRSGFGFGVLMTAFVRWQGWRQRRVPAEEDGS